MERTCVRMVEGTSALKQLIEFTGYKPLGRSRRGWKNNTRIYLIEISINTRNWINLVQDRDYWKTLVNAALHLRVS